jgi:sterol desaturase/sphingolipid hydroxylase (fatty acid hydroxylase superfamily)
MVFILKSIIFFFTAVLYTSFEYLYSTIARDGKHFKEETVPALHNGLILMCTETISATLFLLVSLRVYDYLWHDTPRSSFVSIAISILLIDILYYWYHALHHRSKRLFTIHRIHHVGNRYNLSLSVMLPWLGQAYIYVLLIPLVLFHLSPYAILTAYFFTLTYQFFTHVAYADVPRWVDYIFITPHNHRVHHHTDRVHQMHNFGAVLSVWDRLFGTYMNTPKEEKEEFGIPNTSQADFMRMQQKTITQFFKK